MKYLLKAVALCAFIAGSAAAQGEQETPGALQAAGGKDHTYVDQQSAAAGSIRQVLGRIRLPEGFRIELYALVPGARHMALAPQDAVLFVGTRNSKVWAVHDRDGNKVADEVRDFAPSLRFDVPNGVAVARDGTLFIAERNRVLKFPGAGSDPQGAGQAAVPVVAQGKLIPPREEGRNHTSRVIKIGPDGKLYISLGQPHNVAPREKLDLYEATGIGGIIRMNRDGTGREVYTYGVRNSVGHDFHPSTGELWFTDNQVDGMGDDIPPGEINRQTKAGQHFGHPWFGGGSVRTRAYANDMPPAGIVMPAVETVAHAADLGMTFYIGRMFPAKYRNAIFSAQHGSWNRSSRIGARVMVTFVGPDGNARTEVFAEGWLRNDKYSGRPVDVAQMRDGSLLVSDDFAGAIYRISYAP